MDIRFNKQKGKPSDFFSESWPPTGHDILDCVIYIYIYIWPFPHKGSTETENLQELDIIDKWYIGTNSK